jgi:hypothetical protein
VDFSGEAILCTQADFEPRVFRISPGLRRSVYYLIPGAILLAATARWVELTVRHERLPVVSVAFALLGIATVYPLSWRLALDGQGLVRRRLWFEDHWSWTDFASGRIQKRHKFALIDPERPWWRRKLDLEALTDADRRQVLAAVNCHYRLAEPPRNAESLTVKYRIGRTATFSRHGIELVERGQPHDYRWADVWHLHIARMDAVRRDFAELNLVLPDREIGLRMVTHQHGTSPTWRRASAEEINDFLLAHVPGERVSIDLVGERPHSAIDVDRQIDRVRRELREFAICMGACAMLVVGGLVWLFTQRALIPALIMSSAFLIVALIATITRRRFTTELQKLAQWRSELESERSLAKTR